jgi:Na+-transporting NADH:ubiquinone oxidoreductase subunit NqrF
LNIRTLEKVYDLKTVDMKFPDANLQNELIFTDSMSEENWPTRTEFVAFVCTKGKWNQFTASQHAILKSIGAHFDNACYTYTMRKSTYEALITP